MAFPFAQMPTIGEFIATALKNGCHKMEFPGSLVGPKGEVRPRCLKGPRGLPVVLPDYPDDERLTPTELAGLCRALGISQDLFIPDSTVH